MQKMIFSLTFISLFILMDLAAFAGETSTYDFSWLDPDKSVYVLQNRKFRKANKFHLNLGGGITTSGAFVDSNSMQARVGYFFREDWGFEFLYAKNDGKENDTATTVRGRPNSGGSVPFRRIVNNYMGGLILWSPFYAKINTFNKIIYLDWMIGGGYGKLEETNNKGEFVNDFVTPKNQTETHNAYIWETALQFYLSQNWVIRSDLTVLHYQANKATTNEKKWYSNYDLTLALGFYF